MTAGHNNGWIQVSVKADRTLEICGSLESVDHTFMQIFGSAKKIILGDVLSRRLAEIFNEMRMAAGLAKAEEQNKNVCIVG